MNGLKHKFSHMSCRGSVPVFWEQHMVKGVHKPQISREYDSTVPAFTKHMDDLTSKYNGVHIVNLLSYKDRRERELTTVFEKHFDEYKKNSSSTLRFTNFDFHKECGNNKFHRVVKIFEDDSEESVIESLKNFGYCHTVDELEARFQDGIFRVNCLDCLDRLNIF